MRWSEVNIRTIYRRWIGLGRLIVDLQEIMGFANCNQMGNSRLSIRHGFAYRRNHDSYHALWRHNCISKFSILLFDRLLYIIYFTMRLDIQVYSINWWRHDGYHKYVIENVYDIMIALPCSLGHIVNVKGRCKCQLHWRHAILRPSSYCDVLMTSLKNLPIVITLWRIGDVLCILSPLHCDIDDVMLLWILHCDVMMVSSCIITLWRTDDIMVVLPWTLF